MDWNKEEAVRAREIAEKKMQVKDFVGAKKVALKAQHLFSDLDNISQMFTVCEVHCCAGTKVNGEMDWYGILQVEQTADESSLKKQYRKLARLLHPDKNKFPGAEAAFKLIGEAHRTLSDPAKRCLHDTNRCIKTVLQQMQASYQANVTSFARKQSGVGNNFTSTATFHYGNINQQHPVKPSAANARRKRARKVVEESSDSDRTSTDSEDGDIEDGVRSEDQNACPSSGRYPRRSCRMKQNVAYKEARIEVQPEKVNIGNMDKEHPVKPSAANARRKRARKAVEESSVLDGASTDSEDGDLEGGVSFEEQNAGPSSGRYPLRSCRMKQNVTYKEARSEDDDYFPSRKRARKAAQKLNFSKEDSYHRTPTSNRNFTSSSNDEYLQPQFHDFKKDRSINKFKRWKQIWAVYGDDKDKYPKFYVKTQKVDVDGIVVRVAWVKLHPNGEDEASWVEKELPATCGRFKVGHETETFDSLARFSHIVLANEIGNRVGVYDIYPRIGEVWAIYNDWNVD